MDKVNIYKSAVKDNFDFLKGAETVRDAYMRAIEISGFGYLVPLGNAFLENEDLLSKLKDWRNTNVDAYPTQFVATNDSTKKWYINGLIANPGRILFLIVTNSGDVIGHIGFNGCINESANFEIDNVVRGVDAAPKGIMGAAMASLIAWGQKVIPIESINLKVMNHNQHAINFYLRNGFVKNSVIPLKKVISDEVTSFIEIADGSIPDRMFVEMIYSPDNDPGKI